MTDSKLSLDFGEFPEDDKDTITINSARNNQDAKISSPLLRGMDLDLSFAASKEPNLDREGIQEQDITVIFELPDGSQGESVFKLGQTVEVLKSYVESEYGIPMEDQKLYFDDRLMLNPLSILDYPDAKGKCLLLLLCLFHLFYFWGFRVNFRQGKRRFLCV
jgi:hypothetical protein